MTVLCVRDTLNCRMYELGNDVPTELTCNRQMVEADLPS